MSLGLPEILIVAALLFLILGSRRIGNILRSLTRGAKDFVNEFDRPKDRELPASNEDENPRKK